LVRHSTKNRSHGRNLLSCVGFATDYNLGILSIIRKTAQHFLVARDFTTLWE